MAQVMYLDETPVVTLAALIGLCDASRKYYRFGTNHWAAFKELRKHDSDLSSIGSYLEMDFPKNQPPKELIEEIKTFLGQRKLSDEKIRQMLVAYVPHHAYLTKYSLANIKQLRREFERFKIGVVKTINKNKHRNGGITMMMTRPTKPQRAPKNTKKNNKRTGKVIPPAGNARGYAYGGPVV